MHRPASTRLPPLARLARRAVRPAAEAANPRGRPGRAAVELAALDRSTRDSEEAIFIMDPACANPFAQGDPRPYHYELDPSGRFYYLLSAGCDGQPFTEDDILPNVEVAPDSAIGYRVKQ